MELNPRNRFQGFSPEEVTMLYTGLVEAPRVAPDWQEDDAFNRLRRECAEAVRAAMEDAQRSPEISV